MIQNECCQHPAGLFKVSHKLESIMKLILLIGLIFALGIFGCGGGGGESSGGSGSTSKADQTIVASTEESAPPIVISFTPATLAVGGTTTASAIATSKLPLSFSSTTPTICTMVGNTVTGVATGTCTVAANQAGDAIYNAAPQVTQNITAGKSSQTIGTISFTPATLAVGGTTTASAIATSKLAVSFSSTTATICTVSGNTVTGVKAGTCTVAANQAGNLNYNAATQVPQNLTVKQSSQTIGPIRFNHATITIGGSALATAIATSGLPVSFSSTTPTICTMVGSTVIGVAAGTCNIAADQAGDATFNTAPQMTQSILVAGSRYDINDCAVTDTTTNLMWMRCSMGQTWTVSACSGSAENYTWTAAKLLSSPCGGYPDWRLPNVRELQTIVGRTLYNTAIDPTVFPNTPASYFWSDTTFFSADPTLPSSSVWSVDFSYGYSSIYGQNGFLPVRLVRGTLLSTSRLDSDYVDNGDGTITHTPTGLMWKRCLQPQTWDNNTCQGPTETYSWDDAQTLTSNFANHDDWHLPSEEELLSLVDYTKASSPTINITIFPSMPFQPYLWSASAFASPNYLNSAWYVNFVQGNAYNYSGSNQLYILFVRAAQSF